MKKLAIACAMMFATLTVSTVAYSQECKKSCPAEKCEKKEKACEKKEKSCETKDKSCKKECSSPSTKECKK